MRTQLAEALGLNTEHLVACGSQSMHRETLKPWLALQAAARDAGFNLQLASAHRDFARQNLIWQAKFQGKRPVYDLAGNMVDIEPLNVLDKVQAIMLYSALPGFSRHHFGTDFDVYDPNLLRENEQLQLTPWEYLEGPMKPLNDWLNTHLSQFGFYRPYDCYRGGVAQEPWHISHSRVAAEYGGLLTPAIVADLALEQQIAGAEAIAANATLLFERFISNVASPT
ncbi:M15 family metallopeptidase [Pseudoalteromonas fenneropenaei]|uniref:M15 family metallopeptidase n=1 Tax=Pseudoalteromonas fenneropenaei TaxID=1737459 RepID=A0ABV7CF53_9GAMM